MEIDTKRYFYRMLALTSLTLLLNNVGMLNSQTLTPPPQNFVLHFSGSGIAIAPNGEKLNLVGSFTMEAWIYMEDSFAGRIILGRTTNPRGGNPNTNYTLETGGNGRQIVFVQSNGKSGSQNAIQSPESIELKTWSHIAATLGSGQMKLYLNGIEVGSQPSPGIPQVDTVRFAVGSGACTGCVGAGFGGAIREVRLWNRALSGDEIKTNSIRVLTGSEQGLVANWRLNDGYGQVALDYSDNKYHLKLGLTSTADQYDAEWIKARVLENGPFYQEKLFPDLRTVLNIFTLIDVDNDSDLDIVGNPLDPAYIPTNLVVYKNDGKGNFSDNTLTIAGPDIPQSVCVTGYVPGDFNGDGRKDLFIADRGKSQLPSSGAQSLLLIQSESGKLINATDSLLPSCRNFVPFATSADIDNDGDLDLFYGEINGPRLYLNDGTGHFSRDSSRLPKDIGKLSFSRLSISAGCFLDVDHDGDFDLMMGPNTGGGFERFVLLLNDGKGWFSFADRSAVPLRFGSGDWGTIYMEPFDANNDGWTDFAAVAISQQGNKAGIQLVLSNGDGTYRDATAQLPSQDSLLNADIRSVSTGDLNNDGFSDIVFASIWTGIHIYLNTGNAVFAPAIGFLPGKFASNRNIGAEDVDGDGLTDLVFIEDDQNLKVLLTKKQVSITDLDLPSIQQVSKQIVAIGDTVKILGQRLSGTTSVLINRTSSNFSVLSDSLILVRASINSSITSITITTPHGSLLCEADCLVNKQVIKPLSKGWTWFSLNLAEPDMSISNVLRVLTLSEGDYIKNQTVSATYYNNYGWFGDLKTIVPEESYKMKLGEADTLIFSGRWVDAGNSPLLIKAGWNWIGFMAQSARSIQNCLSSLLPVNQDYIKNQTKSSTFYEDYGWFGELNSLEPFDGFMLKASRPGSLLFQRPEMPVVRTNAISGISATGAVSGGEISSDGGGLITERGVCWAQKEMPTLDDFKVIAGNGIGTFSSQLAVLAPDKTYFARAYAVNSTGTKYGNEYHFTTDPLDFSELKISFVEDTLRVGDETRVIGEVIGKDGKTIMAVPVDWSSSNFQIAQVDPKGGIKTFGVGDVSIIGTVSGRTSSALLRVNRSQNSRNYLKTSYELSNCIEWINIDSVYRSPFEKEFHDIFISTEICQLDFNGDGLEDIFSANPDSLDLINSNHPLVLYRNLGGTYLRQEIKSLYTNGCKTLVGDFNNDSLPDIFSLSAVDPPAGGDGRDYFFGFNVYFNDGHGGFTRKSYSEYPGFWYAGASGDLDNDGDLDVVAFNFHYGATGIKSKICWNDGKGVFSFDTAGIGNFQGVDHCEMIDMNNDGFLDLLINWVTSNPEHVNHFEILWGDGTGFSENSRTEITPIDNAYLLDLDLADLDGDRINEVIISTDWDNRGWSLQVFKTGDNGRSYSDVTARFIPENVKKSEDGIVVFFRVQDIDKNGKMDIFSTDKKSNIRWEQDLDGVFRRK